MALVIEDVTLIDGTGAPAQAGVSVVVEGDRIVQVAGREQVQPPAGAERIDGRGTWLLPGLVDMHVHVALVGEEALPLWLGTGVTTVRDVGGDITRLLPLRDAINRGERLGPRVLCYGPMLDGVPSIFGPNAAALSNLSWTNESPEQGEQSIDRLIAAGVDGVKLYAGLRPDVLGAMIRRVNGRIPVTGHLGRTWASEAIAAGINCLEHVYATVYQDVVPPEHRHEREKGNGSLPNYWTWLSTGWAAADLDAPYVRQFVELLVSHNVTLSPTTVLATGGMSTSDALQDPMLPVYTTPTQRQRREENMRRMAELRAQAAPSGAPPAQPPSLQQTDPEAGKQALENQLGFLRLVHEAGGVITPSTDVGASPNQVPGYSLHQELGLFVRAGFTPLEAIHAATEQAALATRHPELGTVAEGKVADLILLDADPLAAIGNSRSVRTVIRAGKVHDAAALLASFPANQ